MTNRKSTSTKWKRSSVAACTREPVGLFTIIEPTSYVPCLSEQFLIKWKSYSYTENTWEPLDNLVGCEKAMEAFQVSITTTILPRTLIKSSRMPQKHAVRSLLGWPQRMEPRVQRRAIKPRVYLNF